MSKGVCPFTRLFGPQSALPAGGGSSSSSSHLSPNSGSGAQTPGTYSALATPSFEPNSPSDHLFPEQVSIGSIVAGINKLPHPESSQYNDLTVEDVDLPEELVWNEEISKLLKVGTARAHQDAETSAGAEALVKGQLELEEYIRWNAILWRVYNALELSLEENADHPVLAPTYDPATLARSTLIANDIKYLLTLLPSSLLSTTPSPYASTFSDASSPLPPFPLPAFLLPIFTSPPPALTAYITHLRTLSRDRPEGILAHSYVRYLGDMSGGQFIAARVKRAYALPKVQGHEFYHFSQGGKGGEEGESMADVKRRLGEIKDWFRRGMDEGVGEDQETKKYLVKEANLAFALNTHLFSLINPPSPTSSSLVPSTSTEQALATSPAAAAFSGNQPLDPSRPQKRYFELQAEKRAAEAAAKAANATQTPWRETIQRFALAALAVGFGQVVAKYGMPYARQLYDEYMA